MSCVSGKPSFPRSSHLKEVVDGVTTGLGSLGSQQGVHQRLERLAVLLREGGAKSLLEDVKSSKGSSAGQATNAMPVAASPVVKQAKLPATTRGVLTDVLRELEELRDILRQD